LGVFGLFATAILNELIRKLQLLWRRSAPPVEANNSGAPGLKVTPQYERGLRLRRAGDFEAALNVFQSITALEHDHVCAWIQQAGIYLELHRIEEAGDAFQMALAFDSDNVEALVGLGRMTRDSNSTQSIKYLNRATTLHPKNATLHFESALSYNRAGQTHAAEEQYRRAIELDPTHTGALVNLGLLYLVQSGEPLQAQSLLERAVALDPNLIAAQANLGLALQEQGKHEAAYAHYKRLIDSHPEIVEYRWNRGLALLSEGKFGVGWEDYVLRNERGIGAGPRRFPFTASRGWVTK
jgi:Flp pilus assembly protein TadD